MTQKNNGQPLYRQVANDIRAAIRNGRYQPGDSIPTEPALGAMYGVSIGTIRQSVNILINEGMLAREQGRGTFVHSVVSPVTSGKTLHARIGLLMPLGNDSMFAQLASGVEEQAFLAGHQVILSDTRNDHDLELRKLKLLLDHGMDGVIWMIADTGPCRYAHRLLKEADIPTVLVDRTNEEIDYDFVASDNITAMRQVVEHLVAQKRKHLAFIAERDHVSSMQERKEGFLSGLHDCGLDADPKAILISHAHSYENGRRCMLRLLRSGRSVDAVCCGQLDTAIGVYDVLEEKGIDIPGEIALVAFDDRPQSSLTHLSLSTVRQNIREVGRRAMELLSARITGKEIGPPRIVRVPTELVIRKSSKIPDDIQSQVGKNANRIAKERKIMLF